MNDVAIIMGSQSDMKVMQACKSILSELCITHELKIVSAHRTPKRLYEFSLSAEEKGFKVIIAGAGGAAHLPGMVASLTTLPVIGVPIISSTLNGIDSLLSIVQMPRGICVMTVAINGSENAALSAASILALHDSDIKYRLNAYRKNMSDEVREIPLET